MDNVVVLEGEAWGVRGQVPQLDSGIARGTGQDVGGGGVEQDVADFAVVVSEDKAIPAGRRTGCDRSICEQG